MAKSKKPDDTPEETPQDNESFITRLRREGELLKYLREKNKLTAAEKKQLVEIAKSHEEIYKQLEKIIQSEESYKKLVDEILDEIVETTEKLGFQQKIHLSVKSELEKILKLESKITNASSMQRMYILSQQDAMKKLSSSTRVSSIALGELSDQLSKLSLLQDILKFDGKKLNREAKQLARTLGFESLIEPAGKITEALESAIKSRKISLLATKRQIGLIQDFRVNIERIVDKINLMYSKYSAFINLIPVVGPTLAQSFDIARNNAIQALDVFTNAIENGEKPTTALRKAFKSITSEISTAEALMGGLAIAIFSAYKIFQELNETVSSISKETNLSSQQAYQLYKNALKANTEFSNSVSTVSDLVAVQTSLTNEFTRTLEVQPKILAQISNAGKALGYSQEQAAQLFATLTELGASNELAGNLSVAVGELAKANKLAPGVITKDIIENADLLARSFAGYPKQAALAVVQIRKLGYSLAQAGKVADHLLDIEGSLTAQMEASIALGRLIDVSLARRKMLNGDLAGMMQEIAAQTGSYYQFTKMSVPQRMLLARAFGMEVSELQRSLYIREKLGNLSAEEQALAQKHLSTLQGVENMSAGALRAELSKVQQAERLNVAFGKIKTALIQIILPLAEALAPALTLAAHIVSGIAVPLSKIGQLLGWIVDKLGSIPAIIGGVIGGVYLLRKTISGIGPILTGTKTLLGSLFSPDIYKSFFKGLANNFKSIFAKGGLRKAIEAIQSPFSKKDALSTARRKLSDKQIQYGFGGKKAKDLLSKEAQQTLRTPEPAGTGMKIRSFLTNLGEGLKELGKDFGRKMKGILVMTAAGVSLTGSFALALRMVKDVDPKTILAFSTGVGILGASLNVLGKQSKGVLKGAAALSVLGVGLITSAFAFKQVSGLDVVSIAGFAGAITVLGTATALLGKLSQSIVKGSVALGLLGAALVPAALAFKLIKGIDVKSLLTFGAAVPLLGLAIAGLGTLAGPMLAGALGIAAAGLALIPFAYAMKQISGLKLKDILIAATAIAGIGTVFAGMSALAGPMLLGAVGIGAMGLALLPFSKALSMMVGINYKALLSTVAAITSLSAVGALLGLAAPSIMIGAAALGFLSLALLPLGKIFKQVGDGMTSFSTGVASFSSSISNIHKSQFKLLADGIREVGKAIDELDGAKLESLGKIFPKETQISTSSVNKQEPVSLTQTAAKAEVQQQQNIQQTTSNTGASSPASMDMAKMTTLLSKILIAMEGLRSSPPPVYIVMDDGTARQIETIVKRNL